MLHTHTDHRHTVTVAISIHFDSSPGTDLLLFFGSLHLAAGSRKGCEIIRWQGSNSWRSHVYMNLNNLTYSWKFAWRWMKTLETALVNSWCPIFDDKESLWGQMGQITIHMSWVRGFGNTSSSGMAMLFRVASERLKNARHAHIQPPSSPPSRAWPTTSRSTFFRRLVHWTAGCCYKGRCVMDPRAI